MLDVITDRKLVGGNSTVTPKYTYPFDTTMEGWTNNNTSQPTPVNDGGRIKVTGNVNSIGIKRDVVLSLPGTYLFTVEVDKTAFTPNVSLWLTTSSEVLIHSSLVSGLGKKYITTAVTLDGSGTATYKLIVRRTTGTAATTENPQTFYIDNVTVSEITNTLTAGLQPDVVEYHDYDPFGMLINQRTKSESGGYRYGFNGKEKDNELKGDGNSYDFGARMYDPRVGRWFAPDALEKKYPDFSTYSFVSNYVLNAVDLDGRDIIFLNKNGQVIKVVNDGSALIKIVEADSKTKKNLSSYDIGYGLFNGNNRQIVANVVGFYSRKAGIPKSIIVGASGNKTNESVAFTEPDKKHIYVNPQENGYVHTLLNNKYNLISVLEHERFHSEEKLEDENNVYNYSKHAQVYIKQMSSPTFAKTSSEYKKGTVLSLVSYIEGAKTNGEDYLNIIKEFNNKKTGYRIVDRDSGGIQVFNSTTGDEVVPVLHPPLKSPH